MVIGSRPPKLQRFGRGLHLVYVAVQGVVHNAAESIRQVHQERGPHPHTLFYLLNGDTEESILRATVKWMVDGNIERAIDVSRSAGSFAAA